MRIKHVIGEVAIAILMYGCSPKQDANNSLSAGFKIIGRVSGVRDSTWLFLQTTSNQLLDSAQVVNGQFSMKGQITDSVTAANVILRTKDFSNYKFFWVERSDIKFDAEKGNFRFADVSGSKTQAEADVYDATMQPLDKMVDSINNVARDPNFDQANVGEVNRFRAELDQKRRILSIKFIKDNPNSMVSASLLDDYAMTWGRDSVKVLYVLLGTELRNSSFGKDVARFIELNKDVKIGYAFADFTQENYQGEKATLSDLKGKVILLEFWASWCGPCRQTNPDLVKTYQAFKGKGFEVFGVSLDQNKDQWLQAIKKDGLLWTNVSELNGPKNSAAIIYGISAIPENYLIDKTGTIIARNINDSELNKRLGELLN